jgi:hypothetical protein
MGDPSKSLARRFPEHAATIRRLQACDPSFRCICEDYGAVQRALRHWQAASPAMPERVAEYRQSLQELEAEVLTILDRARDSSEGHVADGCGRNKKLAGE